MTTHDITPHTQDELTIQEAKNLQPFMPVFFPMPFIRFSMTRTSLFYDGENTQVEAEQHQFENGRLDSRYFEGTLAGNYMKTMTQIMEKQMEWFYKSVSFFLPFK